MNVTAQKTSTDILKTQQIEGVVMIGYGTQKKETFTGIIGLITAKDLADKPNSKSCEFDAGQSCWRSNSSFSEFRLGFRGFRDLDRYQF